MPKQWKLAELPFLVGIPVPCLDNKGKRIPETLMHSDMRDGGHHFDGADKSLASVVLKLVRITK